MVTLGKKYKTNELSGIDHDGDAFIHLETVNTRRVRKKNTIKDILKICFWFVLGMVIYIVTSHIGGII